jgi:hypothetical protein
MDMLSPKWQASPKGCITLIALVVLAIVIANLLPHPLLPLWVYALIGVK